MMLSLLGTGSTFVAALLAVLWLLRSMGARPVEARIRSLTMEHLEAPAGASAPFRQRVVAPAVRAVGERLASLLPARLVRRIERRLVQAERPMTPAAFFALLAGCGTLLAGTYVVLIVAASEGAPPPAALLLVVPLGTLGALLPILWLSSHVRSRQRAILRGLPDSLDLLTLCVEAGLGLDAAFQQVAGKQSGPLVGELRQMLREVALGKTRRQALLDLAERTGVEDVRSLVTAVIQAEQLGTSLGKVLRIQAQHLRVRRRQRAEEEARRAPVKMVFPLVFCLMPSLFIFILGPVVVSIVDYLSSS